MSQVRDFLLIYSVLVFAGGYNRISSSRHVSLCSPGGLLCQCYSLAVRMGLCCLWLLNCREKGMPSSLPGMQEDVNELGFASCCCCVVPGRALQRGCCHTHMVIHFCSVSLRCSWLMGWARVRRAGWNPTTDSGRYRNQLLSFTSSSRTPPFPASRQGGHQPSMGVTSCLQIELPVPSPAGCWPVVLSRVEKSKPQGKAGSGGIPSGMV